MNKNQRERDENIFGAGALLGSFIAQTNPILPPPFTLIPGRSDNEVGLVLVNTVNAASFDLYRKRVDLLNPEEMAQELHAIRQHLLDSMQKAMCENCTTMECMATEGMVQ